MVYLGEWMMNRSCFVLFVGKFDFVGLFDSEGLSDSVRLR